MDIVAVRRSKTMFHNMSQHKMCFTGGFHFLPLSVSCGKLEINNHAETETGTWQRCERAIHLSDLKDRFGTDLYRYLGEKYYHNNRILLLSRLG